MKIKINKNKLLAALDLISGVAKENKIRPVIAGTLIQSIDNKITLSGTDLEQTIKIDLDGEIIQSGSVVLDHREAIEYIKLIDEDDVVMKLEDDMLVINNASFVILNAEDYPNIPITDEEGMIVERFKFLQAIRKVVLSASKDQSNLAVAGIRINGADYVGTDTYRMLVDKSENTGIEKTIPINSVTNIIKILEKNDNKEIKLLKGEHFGVLIGEVSYITRIIDLSFPDYNNILENTIVLSDKEIQINSKQFVKVLKKINTVSSKNIEFKFGAKFEIKEKKLIITSNNQKSKIKEKIDIINLGNIDLKTSLNVKFIIDYIMVSNKEITTLKFNKANAPFIINDEYLIMPLACREE